MVDFTWALQNADKVGAYVILIIVALGFFTGQLVPGKTHTRVLEERDKYLEMAMRGMELAKRAADVAVVKVP